MKGLRAQGNSPPRTHQPAWWDNYLIALAGLVMAAGLLFAAITAAYARAYVLAVALATVAVPFAVPTLVQIVSELLVYLKIVAGVVAVVVLLPALAVSPVVRGKMKRWWRGR
ncbi:hypothetical protein [Nocardia callitridis]